MILQKLNRIKRKNVYLAVWILSLLLLSGVSPAAETLRVTENLRREAVLLPPSTPNKGQLFLASFFTLVSEGEILGWLALYDDPRTERSVDYLELYDGSGGLLLVSWIDSFGIRRTAMDRGLLQEGASQLEGALVLVAEGIPS